jgi:Na+-transporting methylmalonyl-CoA/oxaloacetate decarboxylase beta subunit
MSLVPLIQPPVIRLLTTKADRGIRMDQLRPVSKTEKVLFPIVCTMASGLILPASVPLVGVLMFGNLLRECGVTERLSGAAQNEILNATTIFLGLSVGATMDATSFLTIGTLKIILLGLVAFVFSTAGGVLFGQLMKTLSGGKINPMIGAAGVSAVPMAARWCSACANGNFRAIFLLMHAMGPNVAGVDRDRCGCGNHADVALSTDGEFRVSQEPDAGGLPYGRPPASCDDARFARSPVVRILLCAAGTTRHPDRKSRCVLSAGILTSSRERVHISMFWNL